MGTQHFENLACPFLRHFDANVFLRLIRAKDAEVFFVSEKRLHVVNY